MTRSPTISELRADMDPGVDALMIEGLACGVFIAPQPWIYRQLTQSRAIHLNSSPGYLYVTIHAHSILLETHIKHVLIHQPSGKLHKKAHKEFYSVALIILWISIIVKFACDWITSRSAFVANNSSPIDIDNNLNERVLPLIITTSASGLLAVLLSDAILVSKTHSMESRQLIQGVTDMAMSCNLA